MSDTGGWTTPQGWGGPSVPEPAGPPAQSSPGGEPGPLPGSLPPGQQGYGQQQWGQQQWGQRPPEIKPGIVPLRPLGLGEVLDGAVGILRRYPRPALGLAAIVAVASALLNAALLTTVFRPVLEFDATTSFDSADTAAVEQALGGAAAGGLLAGLLALVSGAVMAGAITAVVGKAVLGAPFTFAQAWRLLRPRILPLVGLSLLVLLASYAPLLVGVVLGVVVIALAGPLGAVVGVPLILAGAAASVYLYGRLSLAPCALVLERIGIRAAMRRSGVLVRGDWWRVFGILLLTLVIGSFVSGILGLPFSVFGAESLGNLFSTDASNVLSTRALIAGGIGGAVTATLVAPFTAGVRALLYVDRRMRAEGLDVALAAAAATPTA